MSTPFVKVASNTRYRQPGAPSARGWNPEPRRRFDRLIRTTITLAICLAPGWRDAAAGPTFDEPRIFATHGTPHSVAIGDLNADGKLDLVTANGPGGAYRPSVQTVSVFLGAGDGTFPQRVEFGTARGPRDVAIGDLNGDGNPDLAVACQYSGVVSVLHGDGNGGFGASVDVSVGLFPTSVSIGDLNGDLAPDLVTVNGVSNSVSLLLGDGSGGFAPRTDVVVGQFSKSAAIGDLDGDGAPEVAVAELGMHCVSILTNSGGGWVCREGFTAGYAPQSVAIGDLDFDGVPDLVSANKGQWSLGPSTVSVHRGRGNGTFPDRIEYPARDASWIAIGDLDNDGDLDLVTANFSPLGLSVLEGNGDGTFAPQMDYSISSEAAAVAIGDLNGDGKADLAATSVTAGTVAVLMNLTPVAERRSRRGIERRLPTIRPDARVAAGSAMGVAYSVPADGNARIGVYDVLGRQVGGLERTWHGAGEHRWQWDTANAPRGIYFLRLEAGAATVSRKVLLLD